MYIDLATTHFLQNNINHIGMISFLLHFVSNILNLKYLIIILFILYYFEIINKNFFIILIKSQILLFIIKNIIKRNRPYVTYDSIKNFETMTIDKYSFPSGHVLTACIISYFIYKKYPYKIIYLFPIIVGISRIYLGVHYLSDVIASFIIFYLFNKF